MSARRHLPDGAAVREGLPYVVATMMLILVPIVMVQGPGHTTPFDVFNIVFISLYWCRILMRGDAVAFPLGFPFLLIMLGSFVGMYSAHDPGRAVEFIVKDLYLYLWLVTAVHFFTRNCHAATLVKIWVAIASILGLLMIIDSNTGVFGGAIGGEVRGAGTFENPNMCGNYLAMAFFLAWSGAAGKWRGFYFAMPILVGAILATASNGSLLSLTVGCIVAGSLRPNARLVPWLGAGLIVAAIGIGVVGAGLDTMVSKSLDLMTRGRESIGGSAVAGASVRFPLWMDAMHSIQNNPLGVGPGNFNKLGGPYSGSYHGAHNEYLGQLAERGPLGLIGWIGFLVGTVAVLRRISAVAPAGARELAVEPLIGAMAAIALHSVTLESFHFRHLWMLIALIHVAAAQSFPRYSHATVRAEAAEPAAEGAV